MIALSDIQVGDLPKGVRANVDVRLGLNFARGADDRGQILALHFASLYRGNILPALINRYADQGCQYNEHPDADCDFFPEFHSSRRVRGNCSLSVRYALKRLSSNECRVLPVTGKGAHPLLRS